MRENLMREDLMGENLAGAHGLDFDEGLVGCGAAIGEDARLAKCQFAGEVGGAQSLPNVGKKCRLSEPAQLALG